MAFAKISQVAHYVPEQVVTNHDLAQIMDTNDEQPGLFLQKPLSQILQKLIKIGQTFAHNLHLLLTHTINDFFNHSLVEAFM